MPAKRYPVLLSRRQRETLMGLLLASHRHENSGVRESC